MNGAKPAVAILALAFVGASSALAAGGGRHSADSLGRHGKPQGAGPPPSITNGALPAPSVTPAPVAGRSFAASRRRGNVLFRIGGPNAQGPPQRLVRNASLPLGTAIDASNGTVVLTVARGQAGRPRVIALTGGEFVVHQHGRNPITDIVLVGGSFANCPAPAGRAASAAARHGSRHSRRSAVRRLWARDNHGRFSTYGANSVATVRGTIWLTEDRCDGTLTKVVRGSVAVHDRGRHRTVLVSAGHSYLARRR